MFNFRKIAIACTVSALIIGSALAQTASFTPTVGRAGKDVVWVPTPQALVDRMLEMAEVTKDDYIIDLGSGDGRTVITAAKLGARAHGIEYDPDMVALSQRNVETAGVADRATFAQGDIFESDFSEATVITLFLLPDLNLKLRPLLLDMEPGIRVVSNTFNMGDWQPDDQVEAGDGCTNYCNAYKWTIPAKVEGRWRFGEAELTLTQTYQMLTGALTHNGETFPISDAKMDGRTISFTAAGRRYTGQVGADNTMTGSMEGGGGWSASRSAS